MTWVEIGDVEGKTGPQGPKGATGDMNPQIDRRLDAMEEAATEQGTRLENGIMDPKPADAATTWLGGNVTLSTAPGPWGRAIAEGGAGTSIYPLATLDNDASSKPYVDPGQNVSSRVEVRAMPTQKMSATLNLRGWKWDGTAFVNAVTLATSGQLHIEPDQVLTFECAGVVPTDGAVSHIDIMITFRRFGLTYPEAGDFIYFRKAALYSGPNAVLPVEYIDGDSENAFWTGDPSKSASIRLVPREITAGQAADRHSVLAMRERRRHAGIVGVGNRKVASFRFDHHLLDFAGKVLPLLEKYGIPWSNAMNADNFGIGDDTLTPTELQDHAIRTGGQVWNHGGNHLDATGNAAITDQIVGSRDRLAVAMPRIPVTGWSPPGLAAGGYDGFSGFDQYSQYTDTYAGQITMANHGMLEGYIPGIYRSLDGGNPVGVSHVTLDQRSLASFQDDVSALPAGHGLRFMLHPNYLDQAGYLSTTDFEAMLAHVAGLRDAGQLEILSPAGLCFAQAGTEYRPLLMSGVGALGTAIQLSRMAETLGGTRMLEVTFDGTGSATVSISGTGQPISKSVTLAGGTSKVFVPFTIPLDAASLTPTVSVTGATVADAKIYTV
ncbi:hypothetical protein [Glutamicibacter sp. MCAF14]|uniref:hypothetical protein n=1 Tax=Glutamicibacter sp. MCAF14 TaxID=3233043 RepID=UPI003F90FA56